MATAAAAAAAQRVATAVAAVTRVADSSKPVVRPPARRTAVARPVATARAAVTAETAAAPMETAAPAAMVPDRRATQARRVAESAVLLRVEVAMPTDRATCLVELVAPRLTPAEPAPVARVRRLRATAPEPVVPVARGTRKRVPVVPEAQAESAVQPRMAMRRRATLPRRPPTVMPPAVRVALALPAATAVKAAQVLAVPAWAAQAQAARARARRAAMAATVVRSLSTPARSTCPPPWMPRRSRQRESWWSATTAVPLR